MKQFLGWLILILLFAGSVCSVVFGIKYINTKNKLDESNNAQIVQELRDEVKLITEENIKLNVQLKNLTAENETNKNGVASLTISLDEKTSRISELENQVETDKTNISNLQAQISTLQNDKSTLETDVAEKQKRITALENEVSSLQDSVTNKQSQIETLQSEVATLTSEKESLQTTISQNEQTIAQLQEDKLSLQNEVTRLTGLIAGYEDIKNGTFEVDFYIGDVLYATKVVKNGNSVKGLENPQDTNEYRFDGWSLDGNTLVDVSSYVITENTIFYALTTQKFKAEFQDFDNVTYSIEYVISGSYVSVPELPSKEGYVFVNWMVDGQDVDLSVYSITENTVFVPKFKAQYTISFIDGSSTLSSSNVLEDENVAFPTAPSKEGYTFVGWICNGKTYTSSSKVKPTTNMTFYAQYYKWTSIKTGATSSVVDKGSISVSGVKVGDTIKAEFVVNVYHYIDYDGNEHTSSTSGNATTSFNGTGGYNNTVSFKISIQCTQNNYIDISSSYTITPSFDDNAQFDIVRLTVYLQNIYVKTYLYEI